MNYLNLKKSVLNNLSNLPGWKTTRKIIVIESDDWGSIRMPSKEVYDFLLRKGIRVDLDPYSRYDSLASEDDLISLFEVLSKHKNRDNKSPVITANAIMANPDFVSIESSNFENYKFELFTKTLNNYPKHSKSFSLWQEGIHNKLFYPQLHGREHLNKRKWLDALRKGNTDLLLAFNNKMLTLPSITSQENMNGFLDAFEFDKKEEIQFHAGIIKDAADLFQDIFGYKSKSIIAPCYIWSSAHENFFKANGIEYLQGFTYQYEPLPIEGTLKYRKKLHFTGEKNKLNQYFLVRNCFFEPSMNIHNDFVGECLRRINIAFRWHKPAIIGAHRLNFIGFIDPSNRDRNLKLFDKLLSEIIKLWPDVEFMRSDELGDLISSQ